MTMINLTFRGLERLETSKMHKSFRELTFCNQESLLRSSHAKFIVSHKAHIIEC